MQRTIVTIMLFLVLIACQEDRGGVTQNAGFLSLTINENQKFDPNAEHGQIKGYRVTVSGDALGTPLINYYPAGTATARFDGFAHGLTVEVTVEVINDNGTVVRRGRSGNMVIQGGRDNPATIAINNVPIFANVHNGAMVNAERFVPKIFAPGGINFELSDTFGDSTRMLQDEVTGEATFSVSADDDSVLPVYIPRLTAGEHSLSVRDPHSGESSSITVNVKDGGRKAVLTTTAGAYVGSLASRSTGSMSNLLFYYTLLAE